MDLGKSVMSVVMGVVLLMGGGALFNGIRLLIEGDPNRAGAVTATIMGVVLIVASAAYYYRAFVWGPLDTARLERARKLYPGQPWMERADWASRRLTSTNSGTAVFLWIWSLGWWGFLAFIATVNRDKILAALAQSWWNWGLLAVFVGGGLLGLGLAVSFSLKAWRYGTSTLQLDTLPAFIGERFAGAVIARLDPKPRNNLALELVCEEAEWVTSGYGKDRTTRLVVRPQGSVSKQIEAARLQPAKEGLRALIEIEVPKGLPEPSRDAQGNGIRWWIKVSTTGDDPPFSAEFEVPVYERDRSQR